MEMLLRPRLSFHLSTKKQEKKRVKQSLGYEQVKFKANPENLA
jgi:hypothetical protein